MERLNVCPRVNAKGKCIASGLNRVGLAKEGFLSGPGLAAQTCPALAPPPSDSHTPAVQSRRHPVQSPPPEAPVRVQAAWGVCSPLWEMAPPRMRTFLSRASRCYLSKTEILSTGDKACCARDRHSSDSLRVVINPGKNVTNPRDSGLQPAARLLRPSPREGQAWKDCGGRGAVRAAGGGGRV